MFAIPPSGWRSTFDLNKSNYCFSVNTAFSTLRTLIPTEPKDRKLSKIETLRLASSYISHLGTQLMAGEYVQKIVNLFFKKLLIGPVDQPCLRLIQNIQDDDSSNSSSGSRQVCTFCISHKKFPVSFHSIPREFSFDGGNFQKLLPQEDYSCQTYSNCQQLILEPSDSLSSVILTHATDLAPIYEHQ